MVDRFRCILVVNLHSYVSAIQIIEKKKKNSKAWCVFHTINYHSIIMYYSEGRIYLFNN